MTTNVYVKACTNTLTTCEKLLECISQKRITYSTRTISTIEECKNICAGMIQALNENWHELSAMALLCVGICEEAAEVCERYNDKDFQFCAYICRYCSTAFSELAKKAA
jgi:hypothetical protein